MDYGYKVTAASDRDNSASLADINISMTLAEPYLLGARTQIERYLDAVSLLNRQPVDGVRICIHEVSCLFEDLTMLAFYFNKHGSKNQKHELWIDVRNYIRHDIRENFDAESDRRKDQRALKLAMPTGLQFQLAFSSTSIMAGGLNIQVAEISTYLDWAKQQMNRIFSEAKEAGLIK